MNIKVVIPIYNENGTIEDVAKQSSAIFGINNVIIVDDGSTKPLKLNNYSVLRHLINLGKGAAMKTGADYAFENGATHVIFIDGDGQHDPADSKAFIKSAEKGSDVVIGVRRYLRDSPKLRMFGNRFAAFYINSLFGAKISDLLSGYRLLSKKAYQLVKWNSRRYGVETEMAAKIGIFGKYLKYSEVEIKTIYHDAYKGVTIIDAFNILFETIWWKLTWAYR